MSYSRFNEPEPVDLARKRRNERIGRGVLLLVGFGLLLGSWKLWGVARWASEEDRRWNDRHGAARSVTNRRVSSAPYLYTGVIALSMAGSVTCAMSVMSISQMHRLFHRRPSITRDTPLGGGGIHRF